MFKNAIGDVADITCTRDRSPAHHALVRIKIRHARPTQRLQEAVLYVRPFYTKQDACRGVHSACRREVNRHKLDICVLRLRQGRIQDFRM